MSKGPPEPSPLDPFAAPAFPRRIRPSVRFLREMADACVPGETKAGTEQ